GELDAGQRAEAVLEEDCRRADRLPPVVFGQVSERRIAVRRKGGAGAVAQPDRVVESLTTTLDAERHALPRADRPLGGRSGGPLLDLEINVLVAVGPREIVMLGQTAEPSRDRQVATAVDPARTR